MMGLGDLDLTPPTTYSSDPILEYIFNTPSEAINQANLWGFDGYRAYLVNGVIKYVPCATTAEYQQATRLYMVQGGIVAQGKEVFGDKLVGYQFTEKDTIKGDPIFTLGNFTITTKITEKQDVIYTLADTKRGYTAQDFTLDGIEVLKSQLLTDTTVKMRFDKSNLEKYVTYASLRERFRVSMQEVAETFPASLHIIPYSITQPCVYDYYVYQSGDGASFRVRLKNINNPFTIDIYKSGETAPQSQYIASLRNFSLNYAKYELYYNSTAYQILSVTTPTGITDSNDLLITVLGDPFESVVSVNGTANVDFYIKPLRSEIDKFYETASDLTSYLLNYKSVPKYIATFNVPHRLEDDTFQIIAKSLTFPMYDTYNVNIFDSGFDNYLNDLYFTADEFDRYKTDLISRFLTSASLQEFDTDDRKTYITQQMYGSMFDNVKRYADGIAYMTKVSYDKIDNIPDLLLKNFAHTLGWKTYEIENDDTLVQSLFDVTADRQGDDTPQEIDIELWRRIIINSFYLFKSKGTRKSIEFVLELVGIPIEIMDINEYVYVADHSLVYSTYYNIFNTAVSDYPIDVNGYPTIPSLYFQAYGGSMLNNAQNIGPYDNGQGYVNTYRKFGAYEAFDIRRVADNKKSWVTTDVTTSQYYDFMLRGTNYEIKDSRLVINSKEADASISTEMTLDYYVYSFYRDNEYTISVSGATVEPALLSFNEYLRDIVVKLINPSNRKTLRTYPVLSKIYWDYLQYAETLGKKTIDYTKTLSFISKFDSYWVKLVQQFVPATTIFLAGKKFANANITRSKFQYKHGLRCDPLVTTGCTATWLGTDGSEFQDSALKPSPVGNCDPFKYNGYLGTDVHGKNVILKFECSLSTNAKSFLIRGGNYSADNYGFYRHYAAQQNILLQAHANYGTMSNLGTGINSKTDLMYFATNDDLLALTGATIGHMVSIPTGTTLNDNLGEGKYGGNTISGTTGTTVITLSALPVSGDTLYPLQLINVFNLKDIPVAKNEYYVMEGDIMFTFDISGNTAYSYIGLIPTNTGTTDPTGFITDRDMIEGCFGAEAYDKYNWVHMKTKFKSNQEYVQMVLFAQDVYYTGTTATLYLQNFSVTKVPTDINFITPPPLPHVCYFDTTGTTIGGNTGNTVMIDYPAFETASGVWSLTGSSAGFYFNLAATGDNAGITFDYTDNNGEGWGGMQYLSGYTETPVANQQYYYSFDVKVNGISTGTHPQPTLYFDPFFDGIADHTYDPLKFTCDYTIPFAHFSGYYTPTSIPVSPRVGIAINNPTKLTGNYDVQIFNFVLEKTASSFNDILVNPLMTDYYNAWIGAGTNPEITDVRGAGATDDYWRITFSSAGGVGSAPNYYLGTGATYNVSPAADTLYYWCFDVAVTGSTDLTYAQQPTIYFHPFMNDNYTGSTYPVQVKGDIMQDKITFEGYYLSTGLGANPFPVFDVRNTTTLNVSTGDFIVEISNFNIRLIELCYYDENDNLWWYRQPHAFGYSMNTGRTQPDYAIGGAPLKWVIPFIPTGTGHTVEVDDRQGMYEEYMNLVTSYPLMHVSPAYVANYGLSQTDNIIDINLTHSCGLEYRFYSDNGYPSSSVSPNGVVINNNLFMSGAMTYTFDGMYPTTESDFVGLGPFYEPKSYYGIYSTIGLNDIICYKGVNNPVPLLNQYADNWAELAADTGYTSGHTVPADFKSSLLTIALANNGLKVIRYNLIKIETELIYDSDVDSEQIIVVKLVGVSGNVYDQQSFIMGGSNNPLYTALSNRIIAYSFEGYFYMDDEIYLMVQPKEHNCKIISTEEIECVGGYILSGNTGGTVSHIIADAYMNISGQTSQTYFTGGTFDNRFMLNSVYDVIRLHPSGVIGYPDSGFTVNNIDPATIYDKDFEFFMAYSTGTTNIGGTITITSKAIDKVNYTTTNSYLYMVKQVPPPFTGVTWETYDTNADANPVSYYESLSGTTYSVLRKSFAKIYESNISGTTTDTEKYLTAFYKSNGRTKYKFGYSKNFFDNPINRFFDASDTENREVFTYGSSTLHSEQDGLYLTYEFAKDAAGYPVTGEFIGRLTGKDPCGNFVTIYVLLFLDLKDSTYIISASNINVAVPISNLEMSYNVGDGTHTISTQNEL